MTTRIRPIVLSGGGSRGPYGAGVLKAVRRYDQARGPIPSCYCGTSVGALNACMAAQGDLDTLLSLYGSLTTEQVVGDTQVDPNGWRLLWEARKSEFNYYSNKHLRRILESNASFEKLKASKNHLLICVTNYDTGDLETFYHSDLVPSFIEIDKTYRSEKQRLHHYRKIDSQETLVSALLASAALPFFFPPVSHQGSRYIDGGVGNNTPTKQAAYFCRYLAEANAGIPDSTICVINDPVRFAIGSEQAAEYKLRSLIFRAFDIFQHELVGDYLITWDRINKNIAHRQWQEAELKKVIATASYLDDVQRSKLVPEIERVLGESLGGTKQLEMGLIQIRPTTPLEVDTLLTFDPTQSKKLIGRGTADCLATLAERGLITAIEHSSWANEL